MKPVDMNHTATRGRPGKSWRWPLLIVGLLLTHVAGMVTAVVIATTDRSFIVLPNYYQRALNWDDRKAALAETAKLGWQRSIGVTAEGGRSRSVVLRMTDRDGQPVDGLAVTIVAAPERRPDHTQTLTLEPAGDGRYVASLDAVSGGVWNFDIDAKRGNDRYVATASPWIEGD